MSAGEDGKAELERLLKRCNDLWMLDYPEVRKARSVYRQKFEQHYVPLAGILETLLAAQKEVQQLNDWFDEKKVELLKEGLDSDDIAEAFHLSQLYLNKPRNYTVDFLTTIENLNELKEGLLKAIQQRRELIASTKAATESLDRLENETNAHSNELQFLRNRLQRFQSQVHHGYTPELEILREITAALEKMAETPEPVADKDLDPLRKAVNAFLDRHEKKLSLAESRALRENLDEVLDSADPVSRWACWGTLRTMEEKYSTDWVVPTVKKSKRPQPRADTQVLWELLNQMNDSEPELWEKLAHSFEKSVKNQKTDLNRLQKELSLTEE